MRNCGRTRWEKPETEGLNDTLYGQTYGNEVCQPHPEHHTLHTTSLHPINYTPTPCTLSTAPCTLHPYTLQTRTWSLD